MGNSNNYRISQKTNLTNDINKNIENKLKWKDESCEEL